MRRSVHLGVRFGSTMEVFGEAESVEGRSRWHCRCSNCGATRILSGHVVAAYRRGVYGYACKECRPKNLPQIAHPLAARRREYLRHYQRSKRPHPVEAASLNAERCNRTELFRQGLLLPTPEHERPRTRGECAEGPRPCPFVSCKWHLYIDVNPANGTLKLNFPHLEPGELAESCSLDVADRGGVPLEAVGAAMNITRERVRQLEVLISRRLHGRLRVLR